MNTSMARKFLSFSYGSWFGLIVGVIITFTSTRILSPSAFGKASLFILIVNVLSVVAAFGTDQSFVRFFYEEKPELRSGLMYNCMKVPVIFLAVACVLIVLYHRVITTALLGEDSTALAWVLGLGVLSQVLARYATLVIRMQQKGNLFSVIQISQRMSNLLCLLALYHFIGNSYRIMIYANVFAFTVIAILSIVSERKFWGLRNIRIPGRRHKQFEILKYGSPLLMTYLITWLFQSTDQLALKHWSSFNELGIYAAAFKIVALLNTLQVSFSTFWAPVSYERFQRIPDDTSFYSDMSEIVGFILFIVAIFTITGRELIGALLGKGYRDASDIMPFLVFVPIMYTLSETTVIGINFFKKPQLHLLIATAACVVNIAGNWMLVPRFGAIGASVATAVAYVVFFVLRTHLSLIYYRVNYNLKKVYFMILVIILFAVESVRTDRLSIDVFSAVIALAVLAILYSRDIKRIINVRMIRGVNENI